MEERRTDGGGSMGECLRRVDLKDGGRMAEGCRMEDEGQIGWNVLNKG